MALEIQKFSHVVMQVSDLARSVDFYHGLLGLPKLFERSFTDPRSGRTQEIVGCLVGDTVVLEMGADPARPRTIELAQFPGGATCSVDYARMQG